MSFFNGVFHSKLEKKVELDDDKIMAIVEDGILDANNYKAIEIYKHNLKLLVADALKKGYIDRFYLIREDNHFPKNSEWTVTSDETSFESVSTQLSYQIREALAIQLAGNYKTMDGILIPPAKNKIFKYLETIDKKTANLYLPSHFRSTKHFTINTPLELTGDYNFVSTNRNYIVIDDINNFLNSGYGYSLYYKDTYLDVSHEPLKISDKAIYLIEDSKYDELMKNDEIRSELSNKRIVRYKGDTALAINMLLTEMGVLPSILSPRYVEHDSSIYQVLDDSLRKVARDYHLQYDREHYGKKGHFSSYYDDQNNTRYEYISEFCLFMKKRFPNYSDLFFPSLFMTRDMNSNLSANLSDLITKCGIKELLNAIDEFNLVMAEREKNNYQLYLEKQKKLTPEMSNIFKKTCGLLDYYYDNKIHMELDNETIKEIDNYILIFLQSKDLELQYQVACYLCVFIEQKKLDSEQGILEMNRAKHK